METGKSENELIEKFLATRDAETREELILRYVPLVHYVVGRLGVTQSGTPENEDLVSQGLLGLIEAVDHFNPAFGARLSTYATLKIRSKILDYLRELDWLPRTARQRVRAVQDAMNVLEGQLHRVPTDEELAKFLQLDIEALQQAQVDSSRMIVSLDDGADEDDESGSWHERLIDERQENPSEEYENRDLQSKMVDAIKSLAEREQIVLSLYYFEELTFKEIGNVLGVTESRVCQIHGRAVTGLKAIMSDFPVAEERSRKAAREKKKSESFSIHPVAAKTYR
jgi:RNA polymerase sigma factor for flagellar operon FliA